MYCLDEDIQDRFVLKSGDDNSDLKIPKYKQLTLKTVVYDRGIKTK